MFQTLPDKAKIQESVRKFNNLAKYNFNIEEFEAKAEEFERTSPGQGYQLAYKFEIESITKNAIGMKLRAEHVRMEPDDLIIEFGASVMETYLDECKRQNVATDFRVSGYGGLDLEALETVKAVLNESPTSPMKAAALELKDGRMTLERATEWVNGMKERTPDESDAIKMISYAKALEDRNKSRTFLQFIGNFFTHFKEKAAIKTLRSFASRNRAGYENLVQKAEKEDEGIESFRNRIDSQLEDTRAVESQRVNIRIQELERERELEKTNVSKRADEIDLNARINELLDF